MFHSVHTCKPQYNWNVDFTLNFYIHKMKIEMSFDLILSILLAYYAVQFLWESLLSSQNIHEWLLPTHSSIYFYWSCLLLLLVLYSWLFIKVSSLDGATTSELLPILLETHALPELILDNKAGGILLSASNGLSQFLWKSMYVWILALSRIINDEFWNVLFDSNKALSSTGSEIFRKFWNWLFHA